MVSLTTRQRDILKVLLDTYEPIRTIDLAKDIHLTARQVNYSMHGVKTWLKYEDVVLQTTPGLGIALKCPPQKRSVLAAELEKSDSIQLVLTPEQRQQMISFLLLIETEPIILTKISLYLKISRSTVISDLDEVEKWLKEWNVPVERKQNYGIGVVCSEKQRQQVLLALIWGRSPFQPALFEVSYQKGLTFILAEDIQSSPIVRDIVDFLHLFDMKKIFNKVIFIEDSLGGRFSDEAVLFLALVFSILLARIKMGKHIQVSESELQKFGNTQEWKAAERMVNILDAYEAPLWEQGDIAYVVMYIFCSPLLENWVNEMEIVNGYKDLFEELLVAVNSLYQIDGLTQDPTLRDGIINHLIPVFNQYSYRLWFPKADVDLTSINECGDEFTLVDQMDGIIHERTSISLGDEDKHMLVAILRAAYIRLRSYKFNNVLLVCPSGMATAQLLTARLKTRFPHLGKLTAVSFRELDAERVASADLIITLMPLNENFGTDKPIIQVSPQLLQCDIDAITAFLG